jgi:hypothetical protein
LDEETRAHYLPGLINNNRFLIPPLGEDSEPGRPFAVTGTAEGKLGLEGTVRGHPYMALTFVGGDRYRGTCYKAANWIYLGTRKGFGRKGNCIALGNKEGSLRLGYEPHFCKAL